eukprot:TRINITY_DN22576_c0_g1_i1.p1 TRINITY_DN22576_c0_g1~~TRINITY_DN22576_c0_g1_i1.p1  ORF type:complete len:450 (+),score=83.09 TRINITY_DN22576_c0_g1_i1:62-1411(+)
MAAQASAGGGRHRRHLGRVLKASTTAGLAVVGFLQLVDVGFSEDSAFSLPADAAPGRSWSSLGQAAENVADSSRSGTSSSSNGLHAEDAGSRGFAFGRLSAAACGAGAVAVAVAAGARRRSAQRPAARRSQVRNLLMEQDKFGDAMKTSALTVAWFAMSALYVVYARRSLAAFPFPWAFSLWQLVCSCLLSSLCWAGGLRKAPEMTGAQVARLFPSALGHLAAHVGIVVAISIGAVAFNQSIKAMEPLLTCLLSGQLLTGPAVFSLLPIVAGAAAAAHISGGLGGMAMSTSLIASGASAAGAALRISSTKHLMTRRTIGYNMSPANVASVVTMLATFVLIPLALYFEPFSSVVRTAAGEKLLLRRRGGQEVLLNFFLSGVLYHFSFELGLRTLGTMDAVSFSAANTLRRLLMIGVAVSVLGVSGVQTLPLQYIAGGIAGYAFLKLLRSR